MCKVVIVCSAVRTVRRRHCWCARAPARTLGCFIVLLSLVMLSLGIYQVIEAVRHPLEAQSSMLIAAAVFIALAIILFCYVLEPLSAKWHAHRCGLDKELHVAAHPTTAQSELSFAPLADGRGAGD